MEFTGLGRGKDRKEFELPTGCPEVKRPRCRKAIFADYLTLSDDTDMLYGKVGN
jgi:hypothetical protein